MSKSPSLRRIQADIRELALDPSDRYHAAPLENDMFEWHFTIRGADGTEFEGGIYHGRILLPPEYPFKPPHIMFLTPSGRFEINTKVCLSFSAFHPELWQPAWGIRLILEALISFMPAPADGAIGALDWSKDERRRLAKLSQRFSCSVCCGDGSVCADLLPEIKQCIDDGNLKKESKPSRFAREIAELQRLQQINEGKRPKSIESELDETGEESVEESRTEELVSDSKVSKRKVKDPIDDAKSTDADDIRTDITDSPAGGRTIEEVETTSHLNSATEQSTCSQLEGREEASTSIGHTGTSDIPLQAMDVEEVDSVTWIYDPLLNLMMILMAIICYLLVQKYKDLMNELADLNQL